MPLTAEMEQLRSASPADYPCFHLTGFYKPADRCRMRCCIVPAKTPDGEDTPKWAATVAARMQLEEPVRQPEFDSPDKNKKRARTPDSRGSSSSYAASSSFSPSEDPEAVKFFGLRRTRIMYGQNPANYTPGGSRKPK